MSFNYQIFSMFFTPIILLWILGFGVGTASNLLMRD